MYDFPSASTLKYPELDAKYNVPSNSSTLSRTIVNPVPPALFLDTVGLNASAIARRSERLATYENFLLELRLSLTPIPQSPIARSTQFSLGNHWIVITALCSCECSAKFWTISAVAS